MKQIKKLGGIPVLIIVCLYGCNSALLAPVPTSPPEILAHRGLHQTYNPVGVTQNTCTARRIDEPVHPYLENTITSIQAAIKLGADIVEFDIHPTVDGEFVIFHDWRLECRTNGQGVTREQKLSYLHKLDIGFGYTADGGKSHPFRGKYIGMMPTLREVLTRFPQTRFLINIKSSDPKEVRQLTRYLHQHRQSNRERLLVYGSGRSIPVFAELNPDIPTFSKQRAKRCFIDYLLLGWSSFVPKSCHNTHVTVPENYAWLMWGWPNRFEARLQEANSRVILIGSHKKGQATSGIDHPDDIPEHFGGIVFTNRIDLMGGIPLDQAQ